MRRIGRKRIFWAAMCVGGVALVGFAVAYFTTSQMLDPRLNVPYQVWKLGIGGFSPRYAGLMAKDHSLRELQGLTVAEVEARLEVKLYDALDFGPETYRGDEARIRWDTRAERHYYFDDRADEWGWCLIVMHGKVVSYALPKG